MIRHILWATDFSQTAEAALGWALMLARAFGATITILHVAPDWVKYYEERGLEEWGEEELPQALAALQNVHIGAKSDQVNEKAEQLRNQGFKVESAVLLGSAPVQILEYAEHIQADIIVMGSHGIRSWREHLLGSTVARVIQGAQVPVMAVALQRPAKCEHILVPTDFSGATRAALDYALNIAHIFRAQVHLLHVIELLESVAEWEAMAELEKIVANGLRQWITERMGDEYEIQVHVLRCHHAADGIALFAERESIDLIVMSTHGRTGLVRFLWGSVAERVVGQVPCPVIAAKAGAFRKVLSSSGPLPVEMGN